jgi:uncharacterized membrane protein
MTSLGKYLCVGLFLVLLAAPASAQIPNPFGPQPQIQDDNPRNHGLWFYNSTNQTVYFAVSVYMQGSSGMLADGTSFNAPTPGYWVVKGWWKVEPNKATQVLTGDLNNRYYYFYANTSSRDLEWTGIDTFYFIQPVNGFTHKVGDPVGTGWVRKGFQKIDTGPSATGFTMNLTN